MWIFSCLDWANFTSDEDENPSGHHHLQKNFDHKGAGDIPKDAHIYEEKQSKRAHHQKDKKDNYLYQGEEAAYESDEDQGNKGNFINWDIWFLFNWV